MKSLSFIYTLRVRARDFPTIMLQKRPSVSPSVTYPTLRGGYVAFYAVGGRYRNTTFGKDRFFSWSWALPRNSDFSEPLSDPGVAAERRMEWKSPGPRTLKYVRKPYVLHIIRDQNAE